ncbi:hypothetical protein [Rhizobium fabae]|uniref:Uncharacterized protein n=1 Tax=Rhizobium fabae TaxID=573179 RepID=A0A7W6B7U9_9HYPH|nr:hypothetical protein [Rhizobium fabae]MBB3915553.1 hypothetical protein [Rhizobium fabae]RUM11865.1 hypothetical protein EFB14_15870 [Rhizobium fabae]
MDTSFETWKRLWPVTNIAEALDFDVALDESQSWDDYTTRFMDANSDGQMIKVARELFADLATEDRSILAAMLYAADFSKIADELSEQMTWWRLSRIGGDNALAVALAIVRQ